MPQIPILYEVNTVSTIVRLILAMILGGILGIESGRKKRPAGFRTYMVVCIASTLAMITNQYIFQYFNSSDPTRIAAQVISGIGFLGAGTIIVTGRNQIKGLTTAAGLWASACIGLAIGIGFYEGAIITCLILFVVMNLFDIVEHYISSKSKIMLLYIEFSDIKDINNFLSYIRNTDMNVSDIEINKTIGLGISATVTIKMKKKREHSEILKMFSSIDGIHYIEEIP